MKKKAVLSTIREVPKTKIGWWSLGLSVSAIIFTQTLDVFGAVIRPAIDKAINENVGAKIGFGYGAVILAIVIASFVMSIISFKKGERSWAVMLSLVISTVAILFFTFLFIGELFLPHS